MPFQLRGMLLATCGSEERTMTPIYIAGMTDWDSAEALFPELPELQEGRQYHASIR